MDMIITLVSYFLECGLYLFLLNSVLPPARRDTWWSSLVWCFPITVILYFIPSDSSFWGIVSIFLIFAYAFLMRKGSVLMKLFWVVLIHAIAFLVSTLIVVFFSLSSPTIRSNNPTFLEYFLVRIAVLFIEAVIFLVLSRMRKKISSMEPLIMVLIVSIPFTTVLLMMFYAVYGRSVDTSMQALYVGITAGLLLLIDFAIFYLFDRLSKKHAELLDQQLLLKQIALQEQHYAEIQNLYKEIRTWRHDYHNHMQALRGFVMMKRYDQLDEYVMNLENESEKLEQLIHTGHAMLDAILNVKLSLARSLGIEINTEVSVPGTLTITDIDLCALLGNVLDNAIEACQRVKTGFPVLSLRIFTISGCLGISVANTMDGNIRTEGQRFLTSKEGLHHGIGMRQIDTIVEHYGGGVSRNYTETRFETLISMPVLGEKTISQTGP